MITDYILKLRFYSDGRSTLNDNDIVLSALPEIAKTAASNGGVIWIWEEGNVMSDFSSEVLKALARSAVLPIVFSGDEDFRDAPPPEEFDRPQNALLLNTEEELRVWAGNLSEFNLYLANQQQCFDVYYADNNLAGTIEADIFFLHIAVRPNSSKAWITLPDGQDDEFYSPLVELLEVQPIPSVKDGVIAFTILITKFTGPAKSRSVEVRFPNDWGNVDDKIGKPLAIPEIIDAVWPPDSRSN